MKINELAKLSGLNSETIRKYRERSLLKPARNPENGYYEYSWPDFLNLLYIRKLRGANLSLDAIEATCRSGDAESLLQGYRETIADLEKQVRELKRREMMLAITARHYERDAQAADQQFPIRHGAVGVLQVHAPLTDGLDLRSGQGDPGFVLILHEIIVIGFLVAGDGPFFPRSHVLPSLQSQLLYHTCQ